MRALLVFLLVSLLSISAVDSAGKNRKEKTKAPKTGTDCSDWRYGNCVPSNGDCGAGLREGVCGPQSRRMKCKVPCNWKKDFGADCKYRFETWAECDPGSGLRTRSGVLKKALYNAECQTTISVTKPCSAGKTRTRTKGKKAKPQEN